MDAAIYPVKEPAKHVIPQAQNFMAPAQSMETQKRDLTILKRIRNAPTEEQNTQSEANTVVIHEPVQQFTVKI